MKQHSLTAGLVLIALLCVHSVPAKACSCNTDISTCQRVTEADLVFIGVFVAEEPDIPASDQIASVWFRVDTVFKGEPDKDSDLELVTQAGADGDMPIL